MVACHLPGRSVTEAGRLWFTVRLLPAGHCGPHGVPIFRKLFKALLVVMCRVYGRSCHGPWGLRLPCSHQINTLYVRFTAIKITHWSWPLSVLLNGFPAIRYSPGPLLLSWKLRAESGFTKFRFQDMTQYPEKSDQWHAR